MKRFFILFLLIPGVGLSQYQEQPSAARIKLNMKKLNFLGSVLYVAAHPDDENTRIITYLANDRLAETAYLSMTRGDGGQNLIGPEIRDLLGLIRTQELLAARRIDGGRQFFTRANDFGYSKSADETLEIWHKDEILSDVVKVFRQYQPDVIITRFPPTRDAGHGHHTSSAMLAIEAFDAAAKKDVYPAQLTNLSTWQPKRLFINTGRWWNNTINENTPGVVTINVGGYSPLLGTSFSEIASVSRSQHKSQGFGSRGVRGDQLEFLEFVKGDKADKDIFKGVNTTWARLKNGEKIQPLVDQLIKEFDMDKPAASVPQLLKIRHAIASLETSVWKKRKQEEVEQLILDCLGLYMEVSANHFQVSPGQPVRVTFEFVNRSSGDVTLEKITAVDLKMDSTFSMTLKNNIPALFRSDKAVRDGQEYSDPYWLREPHALGYFTVNDPKLIGKPENDPAIQFSFTLKIADEKITVTQPLVYKWTDPVKGEQYRPVEVVPPVFVNLQDPVLIFKDESPRTVPVKVKSSLASAQKGILKLELPAGWRSVPASVPFELSKQGEEVTVSFQVFPAKKETTSTLTAFAEIDGKRYNQSIHTITYDHFPTQTLLPKSEAKLVRINLHKEGGTVAYIRGAGDDVPAALRNMGYEVWEMKDEEVTVENLKRVDAVVLGVRSVNTNERIRFMMNDLLQFVQNGGTMIMQYNTSFDLESDTFTPYPLTISRDRVSEEDAEVRILKPDHPALNYPNKIEASDFDGWVQERGLYFPGKWDDHYEALLSMNDKDETPKDGSLLVAKYGEGYFVYTGLSFFRELPEGVVGAYKLFANLVSLGQNKKPESAKVKSKSK